MSFLWRWLINIAALFVIIKLFKGVGVDNWQTLVVAALIIGLLNVFLKPLLILLTLPINVLTLGLFILVINALIFILAGVFVPGFKIANFWTAFWAAFLFSIISFLLSSK